MCAAALSRLGPFEERCRSRAFTSPRRGEVGSRSRDPGEGEAAFRSLRRSPLTRRFAATSPRRGEVKGRRATRTRHSFCPVAALSS